MKSFVDFITEERIGSSYDLKTLYRELNTKLFDGGLPDIPITFGKPPQKNQTAVTLYSTIRPRGPGGTLFTRTVPGSIRVVISPHTYEHDVLVGLVAHEMVHVWCAHNNSHERDMHGVWFMSKLREVQRKAGFTIPLTHNTEDDEHGAPREVAFIAGVRNGQRGVSLLSKTSASKPDSLMVAQAICIAQVEKGGYAWAAYGMCKTPLANTLPVSRDLNLKKLPARYKLDSFKLLNVQRLFFTQGTPTFD